MMAMASAQELLSAGDPQSALQLLQQQGREKPGDAKLRVFLFQLLSVLGQWERAMAQLDVCGQLDHGTLAMVNTYREAIKCEAVRGAVFAGKTTPVIFGKPAEWVALLVQALSHDAQGHPDQAQQLRAQAFEAAPTTAGSLNGEAFDWIADADSRLGPVLEVVLNGRYTWVPFEALSAITIDAPEDLRDMVWAPVHLTFSNGGDTVALVPTCYPGTREQTDGKLKLARATEWLPAGTDQFVGLGQRVLSTSSAEMGLLEARDIKLTPAP